MADSGSLAEEVAMVVPVDMLSRKELAAKVVDKATASFTSPTLTAIDSEVLLVPSEAVSVKV